MSNIAGKAYALNVITPMRRWHIWLKRAIFLTVRALPHLMSGLIGLSIIHFARWVVIGRSQWPDLGQGRQPKLYYNYTLFNSNFNGTWDQYIDSFSDGIPDMLDLAWYHDYNYPSSIPITRFKNYIHHNQIDTDYFYNATPGAAQRDIKAALRCWNAVSALSRIRRHLDPITFRDEYVRTLCFVQNDLGTLGPGTAASVPTEEAHASRQRFVNLRWRNDAADQEATIEANAENSPEVSLEQNQHSIEAEKKVEEV